MALQHNDFEELGRKVQRAQFALQQVRGIGSANGIRVVVDAENRLLSVTVADEDAVLAAYNAALADVQPKVDEAVRELRADHRFEAVSTFVAANPPQLEADRARRQRETHDEDADEEPFRQSWFER
jgi:hypothetical protein